MRSRLVSAKSRSKCRGPAPDPPPGTPLQTVNHGAADLLLYVYGTPPESETAELLESAVARASR